MSKTTQMPSARSYADKMAYYSLVSPIQCKLSRVLEEIHLMKMKAGHFLRTVGMLFLLSLLLVACQGGCGTTASSGTPVTASTGANPVGNPSNNPNNPSNNPNNPSNPS